MMVLDTDVCIGLIKRREPELEAAILASEPGSVSISAITVGELAYGVANSAWPDRNRDALDRFLLDFRLLPFDVEDAFYVGEIRAWLKRSGTPIGPYDVLIAAQCVRHDAMLATRNRREFERVPGLKLFGGRT